MDTGADGAPIGVRVRARGTPQFGIDTPAEAVRDRFHVMRHAIFCVDQVCRRGQEETLKHRGRSGDPLYSARKLLVVSAAANGPALHERLEALLALGDPDGEVALAYGVEEGVARFYATEDPHQATDGLRGIIDYGSKRSAPPEVRSLARTLSN